VAQADEQAGEKEAGIPVTDKLVIDKCGACHTNDGKGNLSRISWMRTTPEGWAQAIHRMVKLNGLVITAEDAKGHPLALGQPWSGPGRGKAGHVSDRKAGAG
jgi:quinohemoprotein amine dehydrogenase